MEAKHYRLLFLSMSCNERFFEISRYVTHDTWAKDIINNIYPDIGFYSYTSSITGEEYDENNTIYVNSTDDFSGTFDKTIKCLAYLENHGVTYDYVIRTNTSMYFNIYNMIKKEYKGDLESLYMGDITDVYNNAVQLFCGNIMILSNRCISCLLDFYKKREHEKELEFYARQVNLNDDTLISIYIHILNRDHHANIIIHPIKYPDFHRYKTILHNKFLQAKVAEAYFISPEHTDPTFVNNVEYVQIRIPNCKFEDRTIELEHMYELHIANKYKKS